MATTTSQRTFRRRESSFISHDLDEEQETGDLNGMEEIKVPGQEVVHQGDVREHFYVVENGLTHYIRKMLCPIWPYIGPNSANSANRAN